MPFAAAVEVADESFDQISAAYHLGEGRVVLTLEERSVPFADSVAWIGSAVTA